MAGNIHHVEWKPIFNGKQPFHLRMKLTKPTQRGKEKSMAHQKNDATKFHQSVEFPKRKAHSRIVAITLRNVHPAWPPKKPTPWKWQLPYINSTQCGPQKKPTAEKWQLPYVTSTQRGPQKSPLHESGNYLVYYVHHYTKSTQRGKENLKKSIKNGKARSDYPITLGPKRKTTTVAGNTPLVGAKSPPNCGK